MVFVKVLRIASIATITWFVVFFFLIFIIIIIHLTEEVHLLEAGGGHPQDSCGGLGPWLPPSTYEIKFNIDHLGWTSQSQPL